PLAKTARIPGCVSPKLAGQKKPARHSGVKDRRSTIGSLRGCPGGGSWRVSARTDSARTTGRAPLQPVSTGQLALDVVEGGQDLGVRLFGDGADHDNRQGRQD